MTQQERADLWHRFWASVQVANSCWLWTGNINNGNGRFPLRVYEREAFGRKYVPAASLAWWLLHTERVELVRRTCNNALCIRPRHLIVRTPEEQFWAGINRSADRTICWEWQRAQAVFGYGNTWWQGEPEVAHRVSWKLTHGEIPDGLSVLHDCDNPPCCNPYPGHLKLGTQLENMRDAHARGRIRYARGEKIGMAKLTNGQAAILRQANIRALTINEIAELIGMSNVNVQRIVDGVAYAEGEV